MSTIEERVQWGFLCGPATADDDLLADFEQALLQLMWLEQKRLAQGLADYGLTVPQFLVLTSIWQRQEGCPMGELAGVMMQSSATMTGIVDRLVRMELVHRQAVASDRRVVVIDLTTRGRDVLLQVRIEKRRRLQEVFGRLAERDRGELVRLLREYLGNSQ